MVMWQFPVPHFMYQNEMGVFENSLLKGGAVLKLSLQIVSDFDENTASA